ncbi:hypothetical protein AAY473_031399 [Plecturocebus cupreus]
MSSQQAGNSTIDAFHTLWPAKAQCMSLPVDRSSEFHRWTIHSISHLSESRFGSSYRTLQCEFCNSMEPWGPKALQSACINSFKANLIANLTAAIVLPESWSQLKQGNNDLTLLPRLECSGVISAHCNPSASQVQLSCFLLIPHFPGVQSRVYFSVTALKWLQNVLKSICDTTWVTERDSISEKLIIGRVQWLMLVIPAFWEAKDVLRNSVKGSQSSA